jgi:tetratricopeptide (TPR) repeat protein
MTQLQTPKAFNLPKAIQQALDFHRQGQLAQAEKLYTEVLAVRSDYFEALHMLGLIKLARGELAAALRLMSSAMQARPKSPEVLINYGLVLSALGRNEEALAIFEQVLAIKKRSVEAQNNRGAVLEKLGRDGEALESFQCALSIKPNSADALYNQGSVLRKIGRYEEALKSFDRALAIKPDYAQAHNNRGSALEALGRTAEALASYDRALALAPDFVEALNNRGNALQKLDRHDDALACYERALAINPVNAELHYNRGNALAALGRHRNALASCAQAITVNPDYVNAHWNEALLRLRLGDYPGGLKKYEWRWKRGEGAKKKRNFTQALWLGETPLAGRTILVHAEQGFGDTIQFARYAAILAKQGAQVILEVQPPLKALLANIGGGVRVIGSGEEIPSFDLHCPLLSLPLALRTELGTIPSDTPYLVAPADRVERWNDRLPPRRGLRVGMAWSGSATHADDRNRSIALGQLISLFDAPGIQFISLQKELRDDDAQLLAGDPRMADLREHLGDYSDTAALVAQLDLVISVDTSVAHLAGALGKPVWILLPFCPDWRWLLDRDDSPWYPSARLFRQPRIGDWESVIGQVGRELARRAGTAGEGA